MLSVFPSCLVNCLFLGFRSYFYCIGDDNIARQMVDYMIGYAMLSVEASALGRC